MSKKKSGYSGPKKPISKVWWEMRIDGKEVKISAPRGGKRERRGYGGNA